MKNLLFLIVLFPLLTSAQAIKRDAEVENKVESLLSKMTLEDKVGQMCEMVLDAVADENNKDPFTLSADKMQNVFGKYRVGSILNIPNSIAATPEAWRPIIRTLNQQSLSAIGVPQLHGVDQIHGASYTRGATLFPQEIGQGASFNPQISHRIGEITAYETRACLIPWVYSPVMDVARSPLWPRVWESFGEDFYLNAVMASELTKGLQGDDPNHLGMYNVAACLKHYMAYGAAVSGKDRTPSSVTEREMMEKYFLPFKACIEAGALSVMVNSANNSGTPFHANRKLLTEWLKEGLNWDGMIVTDWADIDNLWKRDHVAANKKDAICMAINAGIDMSMDPYDLEFCTLLKELVNEGRVPMSRINDAVRRILRLKIRVGLMDEKTWNVADKKIAKLYPDFGCDKYAAEARAMAQECMVLLKNNKSVLPIKEGKKLFVCGPNSNRFRPMNGGWTYTWQGDKTDVVAQEIGKYHTFLAALENRFGKENVTHDDIVRYDDAKGFEADILDASSLEQQKKNISEADIIVAFIGENSYTETVGNTNSLELSANQKEMVRRIHSLAQGKPVILVLNEGRPRLFAEIEPLADAVVDVFLPAMYGGDALADLLSGDANFSGKLPFTYPKHSGAFATYDYKPCENMATMAGEYNYDAKMDVQYVFGEGLSYTTFAYSNLMARISDKVLYVSVEVKNTGSVAGKEPVLVFVSDMVASLTPDVKRLRAFDKVSLKPGEKTTVRFSIPLKDLAFVNNDLQWVLEPGQFRVAIGDQSAVVVLSE